MREKTTKRERERDKKGSISYKFVGFFLLLLKHIEKKEKEKKKSNNARF